MRKFSCIALGSMLLSVFLVPVEYTVAETITELEITGVQVTQAVNTLCDRVSCPYTDFVTRFEGGEVIMQARLKPPYTGVLNATLSFDRLTDKTISFDLRTAYLE